MKGKKQALAVVSQLESGSLGALLDRCTQALGGRPRVTLEPFGYEAIRAANRLTFGRDAVPYHAFEDAEVILSFGADFLETWISNVPVRPRASPACTPSARARRGRSSTSSRGSR